MDPVRVLIADDHPVVRAGIAGLFEDEPGFELAAEASDGEQALRLLAATRPDVVLMDLRMPGLGGVETTRQILAAHPGTRVLVITSYESDGDILAAVEVGASGYLLKSATGPEILEATRRVAAGEAALAPRIAARLLQRTRMASDAGQPPAVRLSPRESDVLRAIALGASNRQIAVNLHIGEQTVKTHISRIFEKLDVNDRTRAVTRAMELGILPPPA